MRETVCIELTAPPLPYCLESGLAVFRPGDRHPNRADFGVFDLLIGVSGTLHIGENGREWSLREGEALILLPRGHHYAVRPCGEETTFWWVHFEHPDWRETAGTADGVESLHVSPFDRPRVIRLPKYARLPDPRPAFDRMRRLADLPIGEGFWEKQQLLIQLLALLEQGQAGSAGTPATRVAGRAALFLQQH